jgi:hypothetical protein
MVFALHSGEKTQLVFATWPAYLVASVYWGFSESASKQMYR